MPWARPSLARERVCRLLNGAVGTAPKPAAAVCPLHLGMTGYA